MAELTPSEVDQLRIGLQKYYDARLVALEKQIETAERVLDLRLASMNEFRASMQDQANTYLTRKEHEAWKEKIEEALQEFRDFKVALNAKADQRIMIITLIIGIAGLVLALLDRIQGI